MAEKIRCSLFAPYTLVVKHEGRSDVAVEHHCAASIGVALFVGDEDDPDEVLKHADGAMYAAKASGRNAIRFAPDLLRHGDAARNAAADFVPLVWAAEYESGNPLIDAQHRKLFEDINKLLGAVLAVSSANDVSVLIDAVMHSAAQHFKDEEAIIAAVGFPDAEGHAALHHNFLDQAADLVNRFRSGTLPLGELFRFLTKDVVEHITVSDRTFYSYLV